MAREFVRCWQSPLGKYHNIILSYELRMNWFYHQTITTVITTSTTNGSITTTTT